jgi:acetate kinase
MNVLVINCGSSSLKYQLIDMDTETVLAKGLCERIGIDGSLIKHSGKAEFKKEEFMKDHTAAIQNVMEALLDSSHGVINSVSEINAIGHRVVHAGEKFSGSVILTEEVKSALRECVPLAPLHNPANLIGIDACEKLTPGIPMVGVFDTAFHQTIPPKAFIYPAPYEYYKNYGLRRYGFHGTSHRYVSERVAAIEKNANLKIVTCHLGNGSSLAAIQNGECVDTSMGLTPLEGVPMGTRTGDIDASVITFLMRRENKTAEEIESVLNKQSGVLGISGVSSDFRDLESAALEGNERARLALEVFYYKVAKYIGSYAAAMNGADVIAFTAGVGENSSEVRKNVAGYLGYLGAFIDEEKNKERGKEILISTPDSKVRIYIIPTNEELVIARDAKALLTNVDGKA